MGFPLAFKGMTAGARFLERTIDADTPASELAPVHEVFIPEKALSEEEEDTTVCAGCDYEDFTSGLTLLDAHDKLRKMLEEGRPICCFKEVVEDCDFRMVVDEVDLRELAIEQDRCDVLQVLVANECKPHPTLMTQAALMGRFKCFGMLARRVYSLPHSVASGKKKSILWFLLEQGQRDLLALVVKTYNWEYANAYVFEQAAIFAVDTNDRKALRFLMTRAGEKSHWSDGWAHGAFRYANSVNAVKAARILSPK